MRAGVDLTRPSDQNEAERMDRYTSLPREREQRLCRGEDSADKPDRTPPKGGVSDQQ